MTEPLSNNIRLAEALFDAFSSGDAGAVRRICHPDLRASQNNGPVMGLEALIGFSLAVLEVVAEFRYEDAVRVATDTGFVEEHTVLGTLPDGSRLNIAACVVAEVQDGRITLLREYLDTAAARGLLAALSN